jgi:predicted ATPase/DNA-binding CsgD family transcriptional regulator
MPSHAFWLDQSTKFVGRQTELDEVVRLLGDPKCRLITLVGVGGIGKTRLAQRVADKARECFADGACIVLLQPVETHARLLTAVADAMGMPLSGGVPPEQQILHYLTSKELLLVLDNFEQLRHVADFLTRIMQQSERVKLLVTSREALNLQEEWLYWLYGLPVPKSHERNRLEAFDALRLFVERARQMRPSFSLADERAGVVRICQLVEGMPLALEMAAAWTKTMRCAEIAAEIQRSLTFLSADFHGMVPRHRSMHAIFSHTWERMSPEEQSLFRQLSIFRGGFDRTAAEAVAGATLPLLTSLLDRCLIRRGANGRYHIHELLRQFGAEQLDEAEAAATAAAHCDYYIQYLADRKAGLAAHAQLAASEQVEVELENIRTAWQYAVEHRLADELAMASTPYYLFCQIQSRYMESLNSAEQAAAVMEEIGDQAQVAQIYVWWGWSMVRIGQFAQAQHVSDVSQALFEEMELVPASCMGSHPGTLVMVLHLLDGRYEEAEVVGEALKRQLLACNDTHNLATTCYELASAYASLGQYGKARENARLATHACEKVGDHWLQAYCLVEWGKIAVLTRQYAEAKSRFREALEIREKFNDPEGKALIFVQLAEIACVEQEYASARHFCEQSLKLYQDLNDQGGLAAAQRGLGQIALRLDEPTQAATYFRHALGIAATINFVPLVLSILLDISDLLIAYQLRQRAHEILYTVLRHPAITVQQHQIAHEILDVSVENVENVENAEPDDLDTLVMILRSELLDFVRKQQTAPPRLADPLTERELEVLQLIARGFTNPEIADALVISVGTVKAHTNRIYSKLQVHNRVAAIEQARGHGLLEH